MSDVDGPLDAFDGEILNLIGRAWATVDPPPADLDARVAFAIQLADIDIEVARLQEDVLVGSGPRAAERTRTITFDCDRLTVMVSLSAGERGVRMDGWLAPAAAYRVDLRVAAAGPDGQDAHYTVEADEAGRFVFTDVPAGLVQLLVHGIGTGRTVITPSIVL